MSDDNHDALWGRLAAFGQGAGLGWGNRIGAAMQAASEPNPHEVAKTYNQALSENNGILDAEKAREPGISSLLETLGGVAPTIATAGGGAEGNLGYRALQGAKTGGALGGFGAMGSSRGDIGSLQNARDILEGASTGTMAGLAAPIASAVARRGVAGAAQSALNYVRPGAARNGIQAVGQAARGAPQMSQILSDVNARIPAADAAEAAQVAAQRSPLADPNVVLEGNATVPGRPTAPAPEKTSTLDRWLKDLEGDGTK